MQHPSGRVLTSDPTADQTICAVGPCDHDADPAAPLPLCLEHVRAAFVYYLVHAEAHAAAPLRGLDMTPEAIGARHGWVYFMRFGDLIKIGWSRTVAVRVQQLDPDALLHHEPGTMADERRLHLQFAHLHVDDDRGDEFFRAAPDLVRYIRLHHSGLAA